MYKGNYIGQSDKMVEGDKPTTTLVQIINQLTSRVFTDVYLSVGVPSNSLGEVGDYAINVSTWTPYLKTGATTWTVQTAIDNGTNAFLLISSKR